MNGEYLNLENEEKTEVFIGELSECFSQIREQLQRVEDNHESCLRAI